MKTTTETVHFTVCPKWLTAFVRSVWAEGSYQRAFNIINAAFPTMPPDMKHGIIRGTHQLVRAKGRDKTAINVVTDRWKPNLTRCSYGHYPDPDVVRANPIYTIADWLNHIALKVQKTETKAERPMMFAGYESLEEMNLAFLVKRNLPTVESYIEAQASRNERANVKPVADPTLSADMAWILPDGKFYPCLTAQEHAWLASRFQLTEGEAEAMGWIKITKDLFNATHIFKGAKNPTQAQINTVFDWCHKHSKELPSWAGGAVT